MRKLFILFLITTFLFGAAGYEILFLYQVEKCKEAAFEAKYENEEEVVFVITQENQNLFHRRDKNEIEYNGMMYDIRSEIKTGNKIYIHAVHDYKEENLVKNFSTKNSKEEKSGPKLNTKNLLSFFILPSAEKDFSKSSLKRYFIGTTENYSQPFHEQFTPPPQYLAS